MFQEVTQRTQRHDTHRFALGYTGEAFFLAYFGALDHFAQVRDTFSPEKWLATTAAKKYSCI